MLQQNPYRMEDAPQGFGSNWLLKVPHFTSRIVMGFFAICYLKYDVFIRN